MLDLAEIRAAAEVVGEDGLHLVTGRFLHQVLAELVAARAAPLDFRPLPKPSR